MLVSVRYEGKRPNMIILIHRGEDFTVQCSCMHRLNITLTLFLMMQVEFMGGKNRFSQRAWKLVAQLFQSAFSTVDDPLCQ
jgi:hypothetical protein